MSLQTTVGKIDEEVLRFTAGDDPVLDLALVKADCLGSAAHVQGLSRLAPPIFTEAECRAVIRELAEIVHAHERGEFSITLADQDVHLAVERTLTAKLGELGKKVHTGRSRNDQVAVDLRLHTKERLLDILAALADLGDELRDFGLRHQHVPMVGRTHMQPAMPSSVGLWATAHLEALLEDSESVRQIYLLNDRCPLGAAAGYGVPLHLDRILVAKLLGFERPCLNVLYAVTGRGKLESTILSALSQVLVSLSRLAEDLIFYSLPEIGYFALPAEYCTGSSIMPQKKNPDVLELMRAKASTLIAGMNACLLTVKALPFGYNRDVQETKRYLLQGLDMTLASLRIMTSFVAALQVNAEKLTDSFTPEVFATDKALELVVAGTPFRDAYDWVKGHLGQETVVDPAAAIATRKSYGAAGGIPWEDFAKLLSDLAQFTDVRKQRFAAACKDLLGI